VPLRHSMPSVHAHVEVLEHDAVVIPGAPMRASTLINFAHSDVHRIVAAPSTGVVSKITRPCLS